MNSVARAIALRAKLRWRYAARRDPDLPGRALRVQQPAGPASLDDLDL